MDKIAMRRIFNKIARNYNSAALLNQEIAKRLLERLDLIKLQPQRILDLGARTGFSSRELTKRYPKAHVISLEIAEKMLSQAKSNRGWFKKQSFVCASAETLPFKNQSIDLIFSNCTLHQFSDLACLMQEVRRLLKPQGVFLFSTLGPDTLKELKACMTTLGDDLSVRQFLDMHDLGDMLLQTKLIDPVMDLEYLILHYQSLKTLLQDLKGMGSYSLSRQTRGLKTTTWLKALTQNYEAYRNTEKLLPSTWEIIYGLAFGNEVEVPSQARLPRNSFKITSQ